MGRKVYSGEFKESAVKLVIQQGRSVADVARSLGVEPSTLRLWVKQARSSGQVSAAEQKDLFKRIRELEARVQQLQVEREILKKAAAFFAREQP
jgi:transposase